MLQRRQVIVTCRLTGMISQPCNAGAGVIQTNSEQVDVDRIHGVRLTPQQSFDNFA
jgi:hypothetical protein